METEELMNIEGIFEFSMGDNVLAYFDGLLYNAKIKKRRITEDGALEYYVHYTRFKAKWDEWLMEDEVLAINSINLAHKQRLESKRKDIRKMARKSRNPRTPEGATSEPAEDALSMPVPSKRGSPKKKLKLTTKPVVEGKAICVVQNEAKSDVQNEVKSDVQNEVKSDVQNEVKSDVQNGEISVLQNEEISAAQNDEISVVQNEDSVVQNEDSVVQNEDSVVQNEDSVVQGKEVPAAEDKDVQAFANIVLKIIPRSMILADKLRALKMPDLLHNTLRLDQLMHQSLNKLLKFSEEYYVAEVLHLFTKSSYFSEVDSQKKYSTAFPVTLMQYFNASVHPHLTFRIEQIHSLRNKGMSYFRQRMESHPNINYIFKDQLYPKRIWCYLYGPIYLLRLLEQLATIVSINSWHPEYDSDTFVLHIEQLFQFLLNNYDTLFRLDDFITAEHFPFASYY